MLRMEVFQGQEDVGSVEPGGVLLEPADLGEVEEELSTWTVLQHEEELGLRGECVVHLHYEWVLHSPLQA